MGVPPCMLILVYSACFLFDKVSCQCNGADLVLTGQTDQANVFMSINYPLPYTTNLRCRWKISSGDETKHVLLKIEAISLESGYDFLYIYDGDSSIGTARLFDSNDYSTDSVIISSDQFIYVEFTTDYSMNYFGFKISYLTVDKTEATTEDCGTTLAADSTLKQSSYFILSGARSYTTCTFDVEASENKKIEIVCPIRENAHIVLTDVSGTQTLNDQNGYQLVSSGNLVTVTVTGGYVIVYKEVDISVTGPAYSATVGPDASSCDVTTNVIAYSGTSGYLTSPDYSYSVYPNYVYCATEISANTSTESIKITFVDYDVVCCGDYVELFDGPNTAYRYLGNSWATDSTITSTGDHITITFSSDNNGQLRGFKISYTAVPRVVPSCVPIETMDVAATVSEQLIQSVNYPNVYVNQRIDYWLITKLSATDQLILDIRAFHLEYSSDDCGYDYLKIYDGPCTEGPVLYKLCGRQDPFSIYHNTGLYVLLEFTSDYSVTYSGFQISVYIGDAATNPGESTEDGVNIAKIVIPVVIVGVLITLVVIATVHFYKMSRKSRQSVSPGTVINLPPAPPIKIMTTKELMKDLQIRYGTGLGDKKPKIKRKQSRINQYMHLDEPGQSQIDSSINSPYPPPPPPAPSGWKDMSGMSNPAFPPVPFLGGTTNIEEHEVVPTPVTPAGQTVDGQHPAAPHIPSIGSHTAVPSASQYTTPLEARAMHKHQ